MGFITALIVGSAVAGAAAAVSGAKTAKKQRKSAEAAAAKQEREARNLAAQGLSLDGTGAEIAIGTDGTSTDTGPMDSVTGRAPRKSSAKVGGAAPATVGGLMAPSVGRWLTGRQ